MTKSSALFVCAISFFLTTTPLTAEVEWRESYYNPQPLTDDLVLPMPCGGAMVFRPVVTRVDQGPLDDVRFQMGEGTSVAPYLSGISQVSVKGGFENEDGISLFYLAKYEMAQAQYDVLTQPECPDRVRRRQFLPATDISKLDIAQAAETYSIWLAEHAAGELPSGGEQPAFVRLPSETEWEFAARGGSSVSPAVFRNPGPTVGAPRTSLNDYIAHGGSDSAGGELQPIGTLAANPLGLHDMLGNAAELVGTPFQLVRHGRPHGLQGGNTKRGGDARTPLTEISFATRFEISPIDRISNIASRDRYTGARLALASIAINSPEMPNALQASHSALAAVDANLPSASDEEQVLALLDDMIEQASPVEATRIAVVKATIEATRSERNIQRDKSIRVILQAGTIMCAQVARRQNNLVSLGEGIRLYEGYLSEAQAMNDAPVIAEIEGYIRDARRDIERVGQNIQQGAEDYANYIEVLATDYSAGLLGRQVANVRNAYTGRGELQNNCLNLVETHMISRITAGFSDLEGWLLDFDGLI